MRARVGTGPVWIPAPTKLFRHGEGWSDQPPVPAFTWDWHIHGETCWMTSCCFQNLRNTRIHARHSQCLAFHSLCVWFNLCIFIGWTAGWLDRLMGWMCGCMAKLIDSQQCAQCISFHCTCSLHVFRYVFGCFRQTMLLMLLLLLMMMMMMMMMMMVVCIYLSMPMSSVSIASHHTYNIMRGCMCVQHVHFLSYCLVCIFVCRCVCEGVCAVQILSACGGVYAYQSSCFKAVIVENHVDTGICASRCDQQNVEQ